MGVVVVLLVVTGVKQSQLLVLRLSLEFGGYILKSHVSYGTGPIGTSELYMGPVP